MGFYFVLLKCIWPHENLKVAIFVCNTNLVIDSFNTSEFRELGLEVVYVLSHFHSDHRPGLDRNFRGRLICAPITADLVEGSLGVNRSHIERLQVGVARKILPPLESSLKPYTIQFMDANHCPGAVSVLIKGEDFTHFYMGDCRVDVNVLNIFNRFQISHLGFCYVDSTFYDQSSFWDVMPKKSESIRALYGFITRYPYKYAFEFELLGTEPLIESILATYPRENLFVASMARYRELEIVYASNPRVIERLIPPGSRDPESFRFLIISRKDSTFPGYIRVRATTQRWARHVKENSGDSQNCPLIEFDNNICYLFYSMHSSRREIDSLLELVPKIDHIVPIVPPIDPWKKRATSARSPPPMPRRVRRETFKPSILDPSWLFDTCDSQDTVPMQNSIPDQTEEQDIQLPFWGHRLQ